MQGENVFVIPIFVVHVDNTKRKRIEVFVSNEDILTQEPQDEHLESRDLNMPLPPCASSSISINGSGCKHSKVESS